MYNVFIKTQGVIKMSEESKLKNFIKENISLIDEETEEAWNELFKKLKNNALTNDFIVALVEVGICFSPLKCYRTEKDGFYNCNNNDEKLSLEEMRAKLLKDNNAIGVDYKNEKIYIVTIEENKNERNLFEENKQKTKLEELFNKYSEKTLRKAEEGGFEDLIHFVLYHTIKKIGIKDKKDMIEWWKKKNGKIENKDYMPDALEMLGYYCNNEVYLCDELIRKAADSLAKEYTSYLFGVEKLNLEKPKNKLYDLLYEKVFTHEFGHLVFDWVG